jgi:RNA polymerase sigma factor (sigma-70 family)
VKSKPSSRKNSSVSAASAPKRSASPVPDTSTGLLRSVSQGASGERWPEFVARYKPVLEYYLGGMAQADSRLTSDLWDDIEQETFIALLTTLPEGRYDKAKGGFHSFLRGILRNKALHAIERRGIVAPPVGDASPEPPSTAEADAMADRIEAMGELWKLLARSVFAEGRFSGQSKAIFLRLAAKQATVRELAAEYGLEENAIHQLNHRITKRFQEKADALRAGGADIVDLLERLAAEAGATEP